MLAENKDEGGTVPTTPVGEYVIPAKLWPPVVGLAVGVEDRGSFPPKPLSSVVVGEALAEKNGEGCTVAAPVGDAVTPVKSRLSGLVLGVGV